MAALVVAGSAWLGGRGGASPPRAHGAAARATPAVSGPPAATAPPAPPRHAARPRPAVSAAVGLRVLRLIDQRRLIRLPGGAREARTLTTVVRYPAGGPSGGIDVAGAPGAHRPGGFPLIVFGHGYAVTPAPYSPLLQAWARAGYVVAAPVFPLGNARAPGGPQEGDLVNQPADMSFVISALLNYTRARSGVFAGLIDPARVAVAGQSDGGDTALAAAYDSPLRDRRIGAAVILSGAEDPFAPSFGFAPGGPPLLATQGTADTINPPSLTNAFYRIARPPKYLLELFGAGHLPPYTQPGPQLTAVERVTLAFLGRYLRRDPGPFTRLLSAGSAGGATRLTGIGG